MAIQVPGDPFAVNVAASSGQGGGLHEVQESKFSARNQFAGLNETAQKAMQMVQDDIDETVTRDNILALSRASDDLLNNTETGLLQRKGKNAVTPVDGKSLSDVAQEELRRRYDQIEKGTYNARQKQALNKYYGNLELSVQQKVSQHMLKQQAVYDLDQRQQELDQALKLALSTDPEESASGFASLRFLTEELAEKYGTEVNYTDTVGKAQAMRVQMMVSEGNLDGAEKLLKEAKDDMSASDYHSAKRLVTLAKKQKKAQKQTETVAKEMEDSFSGYAVTNGAIGELYGKSITPEDYSLALVKAGGDEVLAAKIAYVGVDNWESATDAQKAEAEKVGELVSIRASDFSKQSVADLAGDIQAKHPNMEMGDAVKTAKKVIADRANARIKAQNDRDRATSAAFDAIRQGAKFSELDQGLRDSLSISTTKALETYESRLATNSLDNNPELYWELSTNADLLKGMSDEAFIRCAKDLSPKAYAELTTLRAGLRSGQYSVPNEIKTGRAVADAIKKYGLPMEPGKEKKQVSGFVLEILTDQITRKQLLENRGEPFTEEQIAKEVQTFFKTQITIPKASWGFFDEEIQGKALARGEAMDFSGDLEKVLDAGIVAEGNFDPSDASRTRALLGIVLLPDRPIPGAKAMYDALGKVSATQRDRIVADYKRLHGGRSPSPEYVIKTFMKTKKLYFKETP